MNSPTITFAKIVATPTDTTWSQVYNAGSLFLVLSLASDQTNPDQPLTALGKQIIGNLEAEFFTLEKKDLLSIKQAVQTSIHDSPKDINISLSLAYIKEQILYVLIVGQGTILLKRQANIGNLLNSREESREIQTASGYLHNEDKIILETEQFHSLIELSSVKSALDLPLPSDSAETLSPHVHKTENGGASAIIISVKGVPSTPESDQPQPSYTTQHQHLSRSNEKPTLQEDSLPSTPKFKNPFSKIRFRLPGKNYKSKLFIFIAVVLAVLLSASVFLTIQKQQDIKTKAAFSQVYDSAAKDYDNGMGLVQINPTFARDDFLKAKATIENGLPQFTKGSEEEKKLNELLQKVNSELGDTAQVHPVETKEASDSESQLLNIVKSNQADYASQDSTTVYTINSDSVNEFAEGKKDGEELIPNEDDWNAVGGLGTFNGNIYVLDKKEGVLKFVAGSNGYGKSTYFTNSTPDLSKAVDMTIDGSIWILTSDGDVSKYTKGQKDSFTIKGLDRPFRSPTRISTSEDGTYVYILDSGNARVVQIQKDGTFKAQYQSPLLQSAKAFDVQEENKKIYILNNDKISSFSIQ